MLFKHKLYLSLLFAIRLIFVARVKNKIKTIEDMLENLLNFKNHFDSLLV